jgi:hypothetical protein
MGTSRHRTPPAPVSFPSPRKGHPGRVCGTRKTSKTFSGFKRGRKNFRGSAGRRPGPRQRLTGWRYRGFDRRAHGWFGAAPVLFYCLVRLRSGIGLLGPVLLRNEHRSLWHGASFHLEGPALGLVRGSSRAARVVRSLSNSTRRGGNGLPGFSFSKLEATTESRRWR